jgi:hypothetical protein
MIRHLSPTPFAQLNFLGAIGFPVERYRDQLLAPRHARPVGIRH